MIIMTEAHFGYTFFDFLNARKEAKLLREIKAARNRLIVLVHPFYELTSATKQYEKVLQALLTKSKVPIIILEEEDKIEQTRKRLQEMNVPEPFIIATVKDKPNIIVGYTVNDRMPMDLIKHLEEYYHAKIVDYEVIDNVGAIIDDFIKRSSAKTVFVAGQKTLTMDTGLRRFNTTGEFTRNLVKSAEEREFPHLKSHEVDIIYAGCAGGLYSSLIGLGRYEKVRLIPNAIHPRKPIRRFVGRKK